MDEVGQMPELSCERLNEWCHVPPDPIDSPIILHPNEVGTLAPKVIYTGLALAPGTVLLVLAEAESPENPGVILRLRLRSAKGLLATKDLEPSGSVPASCELTVGDYPKAVSLELTIDTQAGATDHAYCGVRLHLLESQQLLNKLSSSDIPQSPAFALYVEASDRDAPDSFYLQLPPEYGFRRLKSELPFAEQAPVPPQQLMEYGEPAEVHLPDGKAEVARMKRIVADSGFSLDAQRRVLEFGCSNGRLIRWLVQPGRNREFWGADIQSDKILWAIENLSPEIRFLVNTQLPHLPFPDGYFDFIFAGSIFTHIKELHIAWILELRRILAPGGLFYVTVHDETTAALLKESSEGRSQWYRRKLESHPLFWRFVSGDFDFLSMKSYQSGLSEVFMTRRYLEHLVTPTMEVVARVPAAYADYQTAYLVQARFSERS